MRHHGEMRKLQGSWGVALSSVFFAVMAVLARIASRHMGTGELCVIRLGTGALAMLAAFAFSGRGLDARTPYLLATRGITGGAAAILYFVSIRWMETGPATLLNNLAPCFAAFSAALFLRELPRWTALLGLVVATAGGALVIGSTLPPGQHFHLGFGAVCGIVSAVLTGIAVTSIRALRQGGTDERSVFFSFSLIGALMATPMAAADWHPVPRWVLGCAVLVGVFSVGGQLLLTYALKYVTTLVGSATGQLSSVFSWVLAVACLGESITSLALTGILLCIAGVLLSAMDPARLRALLGELLGPVATPASVPVTAAEPTPASRSSITR